MKKTGFQWLLLALSCALLVSCASRSAANAFGPYSAAEGYYKKANYAKAIEKYQEYLAVNPQGNLAAIATYSIAKSYAASGDHARALEYYAKVVQGFPDTSWEAFAQEQLASIQGAGQA